MCETAIIRPTTTAPDVVVTPFGAAGRWFAPLAFRAPTLRALRRQFVAYQIQVGERERRLRTRGVLRQPPVANLRKGPQALHDVEDVLDARPHPRPRAVDAVSIVRALAAAIDAIVPAVGLPLLAIRLLPIRLIAEQGRATSPPAA